MSYLRTFGFVGDRLATLGWILLIIASAVVLVVTVLVVAGVWRRSVPVPAPVERGGTGLRWVVIGGIVVPAVVLVAALVATVLTQAAVAAPASPPALVVRVIGHQWWWEVRYLNHSPDSVVTTANEIHIPVGRPVRFEIVAGDVIHSFWIPKLGGKTDLIPGQTNVTWLEADSTGTYPGQCAEYCGAEHARMALAVVAEPPGRFATWLDGQRAPAATPADSNEAAGAAVFATRACAACHTVAGTPARGRVGPDLTHLASRQTIAAGTLPNTRGNLAGWIADPQTIKPGNLMPRVPLPPTELQVLVTYLQSLR
jgi:cytochrome c oxidase subunit II